MNGKIDCPVCTRETTLPTGLKGLPVNVSLVHLLAERSDCSLQIEEDQDNVATVKVHEVRSTRVETRSHRPTNLLFPNAVGQKSG